MIEADELRMLLSLYDPMLARIFGGSQFPEVMYRKWYTVSKSVVDAWPEHMRWWIILANVQKRSLATLSI